MSPRLPREVWLPLFCVHLGACAGTSPLPAEKGTLPPPMALVDEPKKNSGQDNGLPNELPWAENTFSPQPGSHPDPDLDDLAPSCGKHDVALSDVASEVARLSRKRQALPSLDEINFLLKKRGSPYVMPRLFAADFRGQDASSVREPLSKWARGRRTRGELYCGLGLHQGTDGEQTFIALQSEVLAHLSPLTMNSTPGTFLELTAALFEPTTSAEIVLLAPSGVPRHVQAEMKGDHLYGRFSLVEKGSWLIQVLATQEGGPLPVLSANINVGGPGDDSFVSRAVPGEGADSEAKNDSDALFLLLNAARKAEGLEPLRKNSVLERVALNHTSLMVKQGRISHDAGDDTPNVRVEAAGLRPKASGENVALAQTVARLHRALWASPSHRENMLLRRWDQVGVSVVRGSDGNLYATQLFADLE